MEQVLSPQDARLLEGLRAGDEAAQWAAAPAGDDRVDALRRVGSDRVSEDVGHHALRSNTSGENNVALGSGAVILLVVVLAVAGVFSGSGGTSASTTTTSAGGLSEKAAALLTRTSSRPVRASTSSTILWGAVASARSAGTAKAAPSAAAISGSRTATLAYDAFGRLSSMAAETTASYGYDSMGLRVSRSDRRFVWDPAGAKPRGTPGRGPARHDLK